MSQLVLATFSAKQFNANGKARPIDTASEQHLALSKSDANTMDGLSAENLTP